MHSGNAVVRRAAIVVGVIGVLLDTPLALFEAFGYGFARSDLFSLDSPSSGYAIGYFIVFLPLAFAPVVGGVLGLRRYVAGLTGAAAILFASGATSYLTAILMLGPGSGRWEWTVLMLLPGVMLGTAAVLVSVSVLAPQYSAALVLADVTFVALALLLGYSDWRVIDALRAHTVTGSVLDTEGVAVAATVITYDGEQPCCRRHVDDLRTRDSVSVALTNADGTFTLRLARGSYRIAFVPESPVNRGARVNEQPKVAAQWWRDAATFERASPVVIGDSDVAGLHVRLTAGVAISGVTPSPGDYVAVYWPWSDAVSVAAALSDARGRFSVRVPVGRYRICSSVPTSTSPVMPRCMTIDVDRDVSDLVLR